jgi:hypothetical protein
MFVNIKLDFLGHHIPAVGVAPLLDNVQVFWINQLQLTARHCNGINFYRSFLPGFARTFQPLNAALANSTG